VPILSYEGAYIYEAHSVLHSLRCSKIVCAARKTNLPNRVWSAFYSKVAEKAALWPCDLKY
jgi:hypothetical protein